MRIVVTGGGTGGHIYPALAIAKGWLARHPHGEVLYVGTERGMEAQVVPREGLPFRTVSAEGLERRFSWKALRAVLKVGKGYGEARRILREFRPQAVIGTGGFVCGPVVLAAATLGIPTFIHEQNAYPGITNRLLARVVRKIMITFPSSRTYFPLGPKVVQTGLPIRPEILRISRQEGMEQLGLAPGKFTLLVTGGSRGAQSINRAMLPVLKAYAGQEDIQIIHLTGQSNYEEIMASVQGMGIPMDKNGNITIMPYLHGMEKALAVADLVVGRAGAAFISEILAKGIPSILIPYPYAAENHQEYNARYLVEEGAARLIRDKELEGERLWQEIERLRSHPQLLAAMGEKARALSQPRALEKILEVVEKELAKG